MLLSGRMASHYYKSVGTAQRKYLSKALPFLMEDEFAEEVGQFHFASTFVEGCPLHRTDSSMNGADDEASLNVDSIDQQKHQLLSVSSIKHADIQQLLYELGQQGLSPGEIIVETQLIPVNADTITVLQDQHYTLLAAPQLMNVSLDSNALEFAFLNQKSVHPELLSLPVMIHFDAQQPGGHERAACLRAILESMGWTVETFESPASVLSTLADYYSQRSPAVLTNLRSGEYRDKVRKTTSFKWFKALGGVAACWLVLDMALMIGSGWWFSSKADQYWQDSATLYLDAFPKDQLLQNAVLNFPGTVDIQNRLQSRLQNPTPINQSPSLLPGLATISRKTQGGISVVPSSLNADQQVGTIRVELTADSLEQVDAFLVALATEGLQSKLDNARQEDSGVFAQLTIGGLQ
ncbi:type II secretion system protein GspL [Endozoicomonas acroporae]|uniref:type II secretion system protein GspL n=1 Tax=Endozoicomonas acroporae TaxID=1701104 RepID=UPI003F8C8224